MIRMVGLVGTLMFVMACLMLWRPAFRTRAKLSKLSFFEHRRDIIVVISPNMGQRWPPPMRWTSDYLAKASDGIFIDVGDNLGCYAVHAAKHKAVETVVAFEPDLFNAWLLGRNLSGTDSTMWS